MLRKRNVYVASTIVLSVFFSLTVYCVYTISYDSSNNTKVRLATAEYNIELVEHDIRLRATNLPEEYHRKHAASELYLENFFANLQRLKPEPNISKLWQEADRLIRKGQLFDSNSAHLGNVINALKTAKILQADNYSKGTQLKLLLELEGHHLAVFKPQWYKIDKVILGDVYAGKDRFTSEILAFYLGAILDLRLAPIATERAVHIKRELLPVATATLNKTVFEKQNKTWCLYGKCFYCQREDPVCGDRDGYLTGAILFHIPGKLQSFRSVKAKLSKQRLLDLIDVAVFDFLIQNGDRHHYETFNDKVVLIDNGKGLGNPYVHHVDILAPLYQCCSLRHSTWTRLKLLSGGVLREVLQSIPAVTKLVTSAHLEAIEQRLNIVFAAVEKCSILVKQISKPIANFAKERAKALPWFRTYVCMPPAQLYNWCEIKLKMWVLNLGKPVNIPVLSEAMAIELGANLLGEGIVFTIAAGALVAEYNRSAKKDAAKELARKDEMSNLIYQVQELCLRVEQQDAQIRELNRTVADFDAKKSKFGVLNFGSKSGSDKPPPPPPAPPIIVPVANNTNGGIVLQAVHMMELEIIGNHDETRQNGSFLTNALLYIENELFETAVAV
ncbi:uncharacterized protein CBL_04425 [Carabus blaptoides fortunei]